MNNGAMPMSAERRERRLLDQHQGGPPRTLSVVSSTASSLARSKANELEIEKKIDELEEEIGRKELDCEQAKADLEFEEAELSQLRGCEPQDLAAITHAERRIRIMRRDVTKLNGNLTFLRKRAEQKKKLLLKESELNQILLEEENDVANLRNLEGERNGDLENDQHTFSPPSGNPAHGYEPSPPPPIDNQYPTLRNTAPPSSTQYQTQPQAKQQQSSGVTYNSPAQPFSPQQSNGAVTVSELVTALQNLMPVQQQPTVVNVSNQPNKTLPNFGGRPQDWLIFKSEFERTKSSDPGVNLSRIREHLKGPAKEAVYHLIANPLNVDTIMETLEKRFGNPEHVVQALIVNVQRTRAPVIDKPDTVVDFGVAVDAFVTNIESYQLNRYLDNIQLLKELSDKLPSNLHRDWCQYLTYSRQPKDLKTFQCWIKIEMETAYERLKPISYEEEVWQVKDDRRARNDRQVKDNFGHRAKRRLEENVHVSAEVICACCGIKNHHIGICRKFMKLKLDERWDIVKEKSLCYCCLEDGHTTRECSTKKSCEECGRFHHKLLHRSSKKNENICKANENGENSTTDVIGTIAAEESLPIVPVKIIGKHGPEVIYALLDTGASCCVLDGVVAEKVGLSGKKTPFNFAVFGANKSEKDSMSVSMKLSGCYSRAPSFQLENVRTVDNLDLPSSSISGEKLKEKYSHLKRMKIQSAVNVKPKMIIGFNYFRLFAPREILESKDSQAPLAFRSLLGWYVAAPNRGGSQINTLMQTQSDDNLHEMMKEFFTTESFGVKVSTKSHRSQEDDRAMKILEATTVKNGPRWETGLLWKSDNITTPESKSNALKRLSTMERKMDKDPEFSAYCVEKFEEYFNKGYLQERKIGHSSSEREWYLPWFFAYHSTKKPRLVYDAAAKSHGKCLNDFLLKGPDLIRPLPEVLMRFRMHQIALTADIQAMFHQVKLREEDRPSQLILWRGKERNHPPKVYEMSVLFFGSASSPCSAIYTKNKNAEQFQSSYPEAAEAIVEEHYVDDYLGGAPHVKKAVQLFEQIDLIQSSGGFPMLKWNSNSQEVLHIIPPDKRAHEDVHFHEKSDHPLDKTLGMWWNSREDVFKFKLNLGKVSPDVLAESRRQTKRETASTVMSLFDPLGFLCPIKTKGQILLQQCWKSGIHWDDEVPHSIHEGWLNWIQQVKAAEAITIPRSMFSSITESTKITAHVFCDASEEAFASVVYFLFSTDGKNQLSFVFGKSRVAPVRGLTIPRMELQAAVMGVRLWTAVKSAFEHKLKISSVNFWTDSKTVLLFGFGLLTNDSANLLGIELEKFWNIQNPLPGNGFQPYST